MALLMLFDPHHARAGDVDESTKKYCIEYNKQTITVTGMMFVRKVEYDVPGDAPPEGRGGSVTFPILFLDQQMCAYGMMIPRNVGCGRYNSSMSTIAFSASGPPHP